MRQLLQINRWRSIEATCQARSVTFDRIDQAGRWNVLLAHGNENAEIGIVPDAIFTIVLPGKDPVHFCLEVDRGTMPTVRRSLTKTSVQRKLLAYHTSWRQKTATELFGWKRFRVLFLTSSAQRVENLRRVAGELRSGHGLFLFTHRAHFEKASDVLSLQWHGLKNNQTTSLLDS
jgi:hypothetical protein